ncbi:protein kinase domain-containing protein [Oligoflexus tunisiensis]|uniref:protein kinase domain-containing protein n=1 Tax=Oligoflexus tunisiensis TaxID=708132 RepID=UPI000B0A6D67|nr:AAA family ATPase [Oligoflexus tunisiensis]
MKSQIPGITLEAEPIVSGRNIVFRAQDEQGRSLIVKVLGEDYPSAQRIARFRAEFNMVTTLQGPGVEKTVGLYPWENTLAMVLEDSGPDLRGVLDGQTLALPEFFDIAIAVVEAIRTVHTARIIHKDINPSNICWNRESRDLRLIDFDIATEFEAEGQANEAALEGSLPYLAPEQSGRMNRKVDYRSDYYSLGITFYEMLTGKLPFQAEDTLEWIHQHLTKEAVPVSDVRSDVPRAVTAIISKLMRKNADERYQSTFGLLHDLRLCREAWLKGEVNPPDFKAGACDVSEKFAFPQKLYGREAESKVLTEELAIVKRGSKRLAFVLGDAGVGKSAFVKDHFRLSLDQHTYFVEGQFEQEAKDTPFYAFRMALQNLAKSLLLEQEDELQRLRKDLATVFEGQAGGLLALAPQLEWIIGPQRGNEDLDGEIARNRCIYLLIQFFKTAARKQRPILLFLDNIQWADNPSIELMRQMAAQDLRYLMILTAGRDHELKNDAPLLQMMEEIKELSDVQITRLEPLPLPAIRQFLADTLASTEDRVDALASLLVDKTNGNPFFLQSLLKHLYEDGSIIFDQEQGIWSWDVAAIAQMDISDNVIDVILKKLARLEPDAQEMLKISAVIGTRFRKDVLLAIRGQLKEDLIEQALHDSLREGFLIKEASDKAELETYRFSHDRIQEALYALVPETSRVDLHLLVGRHLFHNAPESEREAWAPEIIRHLNISISLVDTAEEKFELARLNYSAGVKAFQGTAYDSASVYLQTARDLTQDIGWKQDYDLVYQIHLKLCESLYNSNRIEDAHAVYLTAREKAQTPIDQARLCLLQALQLNLLGRLDESLDESLTALRLLGVRLSRSPNPLGIVLYHFRIKRHMTPDFFTDYQARLKPLDDSITLKMKILRFLTVIAYQLKLENLMATGVVLATYYSCRHGFTKESASAFVNYSVILSSVFREFDIPPKICALAETLDQHFDSVDERPYLKFVIACFTTSLYGSLADCQQAAVEGEKWAFQIGDLTHQIYNRNAMITARNFVFQIDPDTTYLESKVHNITDTSPYWIYLTWCMPGLALAGLTEDPTRFDSKYLREATIYERSAANPIALTALNLFKTMLGVIMDNKELGFQYGLKSLPVLKAIFGLTEQLMAPYHFLGFSQAYRLLDATRQRKTLRVLRRMHHRIERIARKVPRNLQMVQWLMEAELARIADQRELAGTRFDQAIHAAQQAGYTGYVALFNDIAGRFYLEIDRPRIAGLYLKEAYFHYDLWGAKVKLEDLKNKYEDLLGERVIKRESSSRTQVARTTTMMRTTVLGTRNDTAGSELDLMAVVKASEILASEVVLESLLDKLMRTTIQSTGAQNATLILKEDDSFHVCATIRDGQESGLMDIPYEDYEHIPRSLIQLALRSNEPVVIDDLNNRNELLRDPYIAQHHPQSLLCVPIVNRAQIAGVIYVEHMSVQGAFTVDRVKVLSVIASQAAIFISNARLYASLEEKVANRTRELANKTRDIQTMLQNIMQGIFTIKPDMKIHSEYSAYLETIFGMQGLADREAMELLFDRTDISADKRNQVKAVVDFCLHGGSPLEFIVNNHLLVRELMRKANNGHDQFLELDWQAIEGEDGRLDKLMVVVRDVTELRELRHEAEQQRRELHILSRLISIGSQQTERFFRNSHEKLAANIVILHTDNRVSLDELKLIFRNLHTVKGNARTLGFDEVAEAVHHEEEIYAKALAGDSLTQSGKELLEGQHRCIESLAVYERVYQKTLKDLQSAPGVQDTYRAFYEEVGDLLSRGDTQDLRMQLTQCLERYRMEGQSVSLESVLSTIRDSLPSLAEELHKAMPILNVAPCPARFLPNAADVIGDVMMHCIRNALDHGIEVPDVRIAKGKNEQGTITLDSKMQSGWLLLRLYDDGHGINLRALEEKGRNLKLLHPGADDDAIASMVFVEGLSTKDGVTAISGRGIGMDAVKMAIESLGGSIMIEFLGPATAERRRPFCLQMALPASCLAGDEKQQTAA